MNELLYGTRGFQATTLDELTDKMNTFLRGEGTGENPAKSLTQPPTLILSGGTFYTLIVFAKRGE